METSEADRRRGRRVDLRAPLLIRRIDAQQPASFNEKVIGNISLAGVYFETDDRDRYAINDVVMASVSVPEPQQRNFPFTRLAGRSRVVRVNELSAQGSPEGRKRFGVALEFGDDVTALTAIPSR